MRDESCAYCMIGEKDELVGAFGIPICELPASRLILFKEQSHRGRCIVASKRHVDDISDLAEEESAAFMADVRHVAAALHRAFSPDKINFGAYGDTMHHLHFHLVPKYAEDPFEFGDVFAMNPGRVTLSDAEYAELIDKISAAL
ncbi:HIT family protein [Olsenella sp. SW781]|uniref:HIT family protein n=1 Tax=Olsenella sp. SW781 TaxID=2530046 RepID=UPI00143A0363|nr:HIT family protein [Olsenella sp. SW781]NJE79965.1 HIT family protein [Olsenella sp. SW781]